MQKLIAILLVLLFAVIAPAIGNTEAASRGIWYEVAGIKTRNVLPQVHKFKNLGISRVHIMVDSPIWGMGLYKKCKSLGANYRSCAAQKYRFAFSTWIRKKGHADLGTFVDALSRSGESVILTVWPEPNRRYLASLDTLGSFAAKHRIYGVELEDEENWSTSYSLGDFSDLNSASDALIKQLRSVLPRGTKIGVTNAPRDFAERSFVKDRLLFDADFISFQTYQNVCDDSGYCHNSKLSGQYAAGTMQSRAIALIKSVGLEHKPVILGLPAYDQASYLTTGEANMFIAAKEAICDANVRSGEINLIGDSYWSAGNITAARRDHAYALRFLSSCSPQDIAKHCNEMSSNVGLELTNICPRLAGP